MKLLQKFAFSLLIVLVLSTFGCGGGSGTTSTPTDPSTVFSLFPPGMLDGTYSATSNYSGASSEGESFTASISVRSGPDMIFNTLLVKSLINSVTITNVTTGAIGTGISESYWTETASTITVEGSYSITSDIEYFPSSNEPVPKLTTIGDFGHYGTFDGSDGTRLVETWALQDGMNGLGKLVTTHVMYDEFNDLDFTEIHETLIAPDGTPSSGKIIITFHQLGNVVLTLNSI